MRPVPLQKPHLIVPPAFDDLVDNVVGSEGCLLLFFGLPGIFVTLGGNGLAFGEIGQAASCSTG